MVRHILVQVRQDQQQFEHAVTLIRIRVARILLQVFHDCEGIRKQPFQIVRVKLFALMRAFERFIRAKKSLVEKMIQAKLLTRKPHWKWAYTPGPATPCVDNGCHDSPRDLETMLLRGAC